MLYIGCHIWGLEDKKGRGGVAGKKKKCKNEGEFVRTGASRKIIDAGSVMGLSCSHGAT